MRPSPGVTVLQYFLMSLAQAFSSFVILAVNFSRIVFPISVCADAGPADKTASKGNSPSLTSNFTVIFIERPLMTGSEPSLLRRNRRRVAMEAEGCFSHNPHCAKASVSFETPRERLTPTDPSTESGCKAIERPVPPNKRLAPTPTPTPIAPLAPTYVPASAPRAGPAVGANTPHAMTPPAVMPTSRPIVPITPTYASGGLGPLGVKRQAMRWREPKIKPIEGAILQESVPTLVPGGCWATAGDTNAAVSATSTSATR